jgi:hypothetical protein
MSKFKINTGKLVLAAALVGASLLGTGQAYAQAQNYQQQTSQKENFENAARKVVSISNAKKYAQAVAQINMQESMAKRYLHDMNPQLRKEVEQTFKENSTTAGLMLMAATAVLGNEAMTIAHQTTAQLKNEIPKDPNQQLKYLGNLQTKFQAVVNGPWEKDAGALSALMRSSNKSVTPVSQSTVKQPNQASVATVNPQETGGGIKAYGKAGDPVRDMLMGVDVFPVTKENVDKNGLKGVEKLKEVDQWWTNNPAYRNDLKDKDDIKDYNAARKEVLSAIALYLEYYSGIKTK